MFGSVFTEVLTTELGWELNKKPCDYGAVNHFATLPLKLILTFSNTKSNLISSCYTATSLACAGLNIYVTLVRWG